MRELYEAIILEHSRSPRCYGVLQNATAHAENINRLCGDSVRVFVRLCRDKCGDADSSEQHTIIEEMSFTGRSCAIATASASLLSALAIGKAPSEVFALAAEFQGFLRAERNELSSVLQPFAVFEGVRTAPSRIKCALLGWDALQAALQAAQQNPKSNP
jgi:nitrogen fixation protein NifU and related proteins